MAVSKIQTTSETSATAPGGNELNALRDALQQRVKLTSLRATARELGMSPTGLRGFIDGTEPYVKTLRRARVWLAERVQSEGDQDLADARAIEVLVSPLATDRRDHGRAWLTKAVAWLREGHAMPALEVKSRTTSE
jgi:hypothetical protein